MEYIKSRRTIRQYEKDYSIPSERLNEIVQVALSCPTGRNCQAIDLIVLTNRTKIDEATKITFDSWPEEKRNNWLKRKDQYGVSNVVSCDAPCIIFMVENERSEKQFTQIDSGIMSMAIMVSAKEMGLDTMCLGALLWGNKVGLETYLGIPEGKLVMAIAVGKAKPNPIVADKEIKAKATFIE